MCEILLSIYIIFGQVEKARRFYSPNKVFTGTHRNEHDNLLSMLCGGNWPFLYSTNGPRSSGIYYLSRDFPMMQSKLDFLNTVIQHKEPRSFSQLWKDKRNTHQWYTFWAIIFYGTLGLVIALAQLAVAVIQLYLN